MARPNITSPPLNVDLTMILGQSNVLAVEASSDAGPISYQWLYSSIFDTYASPSAARYSLLADDGNIHGSQTATLAFTAATAQQTGQYLCTATNASGTSTSRRFFISTASGTGTGTGTGPGRNTGGGLVSLGAGSGDVAFSTLANGLGVNGRDYYLDGNYSNALPTGLPVPTFPFLDQANTNAVVFRQPHEQAIVSYRPLDMTLSQAGLGGLYYFGDANFRDGRAGVYVFDRMFGNIPARRVRRGQSYTYPFQYILEDGAQITLDGDGGFSYQGPTYSLATRPAQVDSTLIYDYFLEGQESSFPLLLAPSAEQVKASIEPRGVDFNGGPFPLTDKAGFVVAVEGVTQILAEDDKYDDYRGAVKCRVRRLIAAPTPAFWATNL